jgi:hypothetical protein
MNNPYSKLPRAADGVELQNFSAPFPAVARYRADTTASSVVTLTDNTTTLEVGASGGSGVLIRWVASTDTQASVTGSNYDNFVPANMVRRFAVPQEKAGVSSIVGANVQNGLYKRVAWIANAAASASSVIASEYA